jgi:predicted oxidoreductase
MRTQTLGLSDLTCTRLAYGGWRLAGSEGGPRLDPADGRRAVLAAYEAGYTLFDLADIYGRGECESIFGAALKEAPAMRGEIVLATKCGIRPPWDGAQHSYDSSARHLLESVEGSLRRMGVESIDLLMIHRPDYLGCPEEIAATFAQLHAQGKVRWFGASNFRPSQLTALQKACAQPLVVHQVEINLATQFTLDDGTLDQCHAEKITPLAWSPLAKGALTDPRLDAAHPALAALLDRLATQHGVTRSAIALAWLLKHPGGIVPIIGTVNPERIRESTAAEALELTRDEWYALLIAGRGAGLK